MVQRSRFNGSVRGSTVQEFSLRAVVLVATGLVAGACGGRTSAPPAEPAPAAQFLAALAGLCGQAFAGRVVANEPAQPGDPFEGRQLVMHVRTCEADRVLTPLHVGEDRSRTWVLTRVGDRLRLKHDHRHQDGTGDALTMYGGDSTSPGTATRQEFPVDEFSKALFTRENSAVSNTNVWAMEMHPGRMFAYELTRPGRRFRIEFDLGVPVPPPPAPWGY
jgi:hypothetical protein